MGNIFLYYLIYISIYLKFRITLYIEIEVSYLTIFVTDVDAVLERAKKAGLKPYAKSPQRLPEGLPQDVCLLMLKDPDGNFVEIVGPLTKKLKNAK